MRARRPLARRRADAGRAFGPLRWTGMRPRSRCRSPPRCRRPRRGAPVPRTALLINPFYPKDARQLRQARADADAGADQHRRAPRRRTGRCATGTRTCSRGRRRWSRFPQVVGITVHLTFAAARLRAGRLVSRRRVRWWSWAGCTCCPAPTRSRRTPTRSPSATACPLWPRILRDIEAGHAAAALPGRVPRLRRRPAAATARSCRAGAS